MNQPPKNIIAIGSNEGQLLAIAGGQYRILVSGEETDGRYAVIEMNVPPGGGPLPHAHPEIDEMFYVAEGSVTFKMEDGHFNATRGAFIHIPLGGAVHAFKNESDQQATLVCTVIPAGLDSMFKELSVAGPGQAPAIAAKYRQTVYPPDYLDNPSAE